MKFSFKVFEEYNLNSLKRKTFQLIFIIKIKLKLIPSIIVLGLENCKYLDKILSFKPKKYEERDHGILSVQTNLMKHGNYCTYAHIKHLGMSFLSSKLEVFHPESFTLTLYFLNIERIVQILIQRYNNY